VEKRRPERASADVKRTAKEERKRAKEAKAEKLADYIVKTRPLLLQQGRLGALLAKQQGEIQLLVSRFSSELAVAALANSQ
jgi:hypothetical protein